MTEDGDTILAPEGACLQSDNHLPQKVPTHSHCFQPLEMLAVGLLSPASLLGGSRVPQAAGSVWVTIPQEGPAGLATQALE